MNAYTVEVARGKRLPCSDLHDAQVQVDRYLRPNGAMGIAGSAWARRQAPDDRILGAPVRDASGTVVARISFNIRLWGPDGETPIPSAADGDPAALAGRTS